MQRTYRQARIHQRIYIEEETGPILIRGADCLPVSFLLLYSSSQAQVCVGRDWVLSDDSNSCCVLALALMRAHPQKGNMRRRAYVRRPKQARGTQMDLRVTFFCISELSSVDIHRHHTRIRAKRRLSAKKYKSARCVLWSLARQNNPVAIRRDEIPTKTFFPVNLLWRQPNRVIPSNIYITFTTRHKSELRAVALTTRQARDDDARLPCSWIHQFTSKHFILKNKKLNLRLHNWSSRRKEKITWNFTQKSGFQKAFFTWSYTSLLLSNSHIDWNSKFFEILCFTV